METDTFPQIITEQRTCPNEFPPTPFVDHRIAIIGEAPGEDEENHQRPFIGKSGQFLTNILYANGINRKEVFFGNVCQHRPAANRFSAFAWTGEQIQGGIISLSRDINAYSPNICLLLGNAALHLAKAGNVEPKRRTGEYLWPYKISSWRGSLFISTVPGPFLGRKCIAAYHPAYVLREYSSFPLLQFDIKRANSERSSALLILPQRELLTNLDCDTLCYIMDTWPAGQRCSVDIEGGLPEWEVNENVKADSKKRRHIGWRCVSLSGRPSKAVAIAFWKFTEEQHMRLLRAFARLMLRGDIPKILQNSLYDRFVLLYGYGIHVASVAEDTMLKSWEIFAELPRSLGTQASVWTREPHWKDEEMYESTGDALARGCCLDTSVTLEICEAQDTALTGTSLIHYRKMMEITDVFEYMSLRGIKYDKENATRLAAEKQKEINAIRLRLAQSAGRDLCGAKGSLSSKKLNEVLYLEKKYPPQYKKENGRLTDKLTADVEAMLSLKRHRETDNFLSDILAHRHLEGVLETLGISSDSDGRVRCGYSLEAETGRVKCYTSPTGSGANLQTIQSKLRTNYVSDSGFDFCQCDLEGADGWTVSSHLARLGAPRMLEDYLLGMKPAKILALLYQYGSDINLLDDASLKFAHDRIFPVVKQDHSWLYLGCKRVQHGGSYLMGIPTMQWNVLHDSYKESGTPVYMAAKDAEALRGSLFARYNLKLWHNWAESVLVSKGQLTAASGHTRIFFGRRFGQALHDTLKEFLAHEPQNNTTWATNLAALKLWNDPENRRANGSLIIEPLHQVHDALCVQWPQCFRVWARNRMKYYFDNKITIAGRDLVIPFDGKWGRSWGECTNLL